MPVQNSNSKIYACPDLATNITVISNNLLCQKGQFTLQFSPIQWFVRKIFGNYPQKVKIEHSL